jgi:hypothetical protein
MPLVHLAQAQQKIYFKDLITARPWSIRTIWQTDHHQVMTLLQRFSIKKQQELDLQLQTGQPEIGTAPVVNGQENWPLLHLIILVKCACDTRTVKNIKNVHPS